MMANKKTDAQHSSRRGGSTSNHNHNDGGGDRATMMIAAARQQQQYAAAQDIRSSRHRLLFICLAWCHLFAIVGVYFNFVSFKSTASPFVTTSDPQAPATTSTTTPYARRPRNAGKNRSIVAHVERKAGRAENLEAQGERDSPASSSHDSKNAQRRRSTYGKNKTLLSNNGATIPSSVSSCLRYNSRRWLEGPRLGNRNDHNTHNSNDNEGDGVSRSPSSSLHDYTRRMIVDFPTVLSSADRIRRSLGQTLCHEKSNFIRALDDSNANDERNVRLWTVRLMYLAFHYHQHRFAIREARARYDDDNDNENDESDACDALLERHGIGWQDYECPDAKYLAVHLSSFGLGGNIRTAAVPAMMAGLASDRVVLFVNNISFRPWALASCPRRDSQCFFRPISPCAPTTDELKTAYRLEPGEQRKLLRRGKVPVGRVNDHKVWQLQLHMIPPTFIPDAVKARLHRHAMVLLNHTTSNSYPEPSSEPHGQLPTRSFLKRAADRILDKNDPPREPYNYAAANFKVAHALAFYAMRPNEENYDKINGIMRDIFPVSHDGTSLVDPETSIGLPIRASDKCKAESECLSFGQHMEVVSNLWEEDQRQRQRQGQQITTTNNNNNDNSSITITIGDHEQRRPTIIFTTESTSVLREQQAFVARNDNDNPAGATSYKFITNRHDVTQDTGFAKDFVNKEATTTTNANNTTTTRRPPITADDAMLSAVSSLKAQLHGGRITIGNCCSNFHVLLGDFLMEGCGASADNRFFCLQENQDPALRVCCGWHKNCKEEKRLALLNRTRAKV